MSSAVEGQAAARAACRADKPVWVAWTLHEDHSGNLCSGENVAEAVAALQDLPVSGFLANCCAPESITTIMPQWFIAGKCRERTDADRKRQPLVTAALSRFY